MLLLSRQLAASIDLSPLTTMHHAAVFSHGFCFSMVAGRGTTTGLGVGVAGHNRIAQSRLIRGINAGGILLLECGTVVPSPPPF